VNALLKFPTAPEPESRKTELVFNFRQKPVLSGFTLEETGKLLGTAKRVEAGMQALLEFVDAHRDDAVLSGIETIAVELSSERPTLDQTIDAMEEAVLKKEGVFLSENALLQMRRMEKLVSEASSNISRFSGRLPAELGRFVGSGSSDELLIPALFFGLVTLGVIALAIWGPKK